MKRHLRASYHLDYSLPYPPQQLHAVSRFRIHVSPKNDVFRVLNIHPRQTLHMKTSMHRRTKPSTNVQILLPAAEDNTEFAMNSENFLPVKFSLFRVLLILHEVTLIRFNEP